MIKLLSIRYSVVISQYPAGNFIDIWICIFTFDVRQSPVAASRVPFDNNLQYWVGSDLVRSGRRSKPQLTLAKIQCRSLSGVTLSILGVIKFQWATIYRTARKWRPSGDLYSRSCWFRNHVCYNLDTRLWDTERLFSLRCVVCSDWLTRWSR